MPSKYIDLKELASFGLPSSTTPAQITQASVLIDTYLRRPEGLEYVPDSSGNPVWMKAKVPAGTFLIPAGISPNVGSQVVTMTGPLLSLQQGGILVADKDTPANCEAIQILSVTGGTVTIGPVTKTHAGGVSYSAGLVIFETKQLPSNRPLMLLQQNPVQRLLQAQGRYGYGRRGGNNNYTLNEFNLLAVMTQFGGPPVWENIDLSHTDFNPQTGQVWVPAGIMLAYYSEVRMSYVAGYTYENLPAIIKLACANIISAQVNSPLQGNLKLIKAGDTTMERFLDTVLDADTREMLSMYKARVYG